MEVQMLAVWDVERLFIEKNYCIIDLREIEKYVEGHIPGAISLPLELQNSKETIEIYAKENGVILYCDRGNASLLYGESLGKKNGNIYSVCGGYEAYKAWKEQRVRDRIEN